MFVKVATAVVAALFQHPLVYFLTIVVPLGAKFLCWVFFLQLLRLIFCHVINEFKMYVRLCVGEFSWYERHNIVARLVDLVDHKHGYLWPTCCFNYIVHIQSVFTYFEDFIPRRNGTSLMSILQHSFWGFQSLELK